MKSLFAVAVCACVFALCVGGPPNGFHTHSSMHPSRTGAMQGIGCNPCGPGTLVEKPPGFFCFCPPMYRGRYCEKFEDPCSPNPCLNSGLCSSIGTAYKCSCSNGWHGHNCEKAPCLKEGHCGDRPNGNYQLCDTCIQYAACANGEMIAMPCPASTVWDDNAKECIAISTTCNGEREP